MKSLTTFLQSLGLSSTESNVYLAGLKEAATVEDFADNLAIKKSTLYHALSTLQDKGLAQSERRDGRLIFTMTAPENLNDYIAHQARELENQQITLERLLPLFPAPKNTNSISYKVEHYQSIEGAKAIVDNALNCKSQQWRIIAPRQNFFSDYDKDYAKYFLAKRRAHKIKAKTLWEAPLSQKTKGNLSLGEIVTRNPRYLPSEYRGKFQSVIIIFDDSIAFISSLKNTESLLVQSAEFTSTMTVMFDAIWANSQEFLT